jgi:hypothetical protein
VEKSFYGEAPNLTLKIGTWTQYEMWIKPNTCTGNVPNGDGFMRFYVNGVLFEKVDSTQSDPVSGVKGNITGCPAMSTAPNISLEFGGTVTYLMNSSGGSSGPCIALGSGGTQFPCKPFSGCPQKQANGHPCWGSVAPFKAFEDDVIFLKR